MLLVYLAALLMVQAETVPERDDSEPPAKETQAEAASTQSEAAKPQSDAAKPSAEAAKPQTEAARPQTEAARLRIETVEPPPAPPEPLPEYASPQPALTEPLPMVASPSAVSDARIQVIPYNPEKIVSLGVDPGYAAVVELAGDERVDNVVVGNSAAWQVTANKRGDRVIVKPLAGAVPTNMIVLTDSRRYVFMLYPGGVGGPASYVLRFSYSEAAQQAATAASAAATPVATYKMRGNKTLFPVTMYDDGYRTVITWPQHGALPATFAMNDGRNEQLVNGRMIGNDFVVEGTAARYKFRFGREEATATRQLPKQRR